MVVQYTIVFLAFQERKKNKKQTRKQPRSVYLFKCQKVYFLPVIKSNAPTYDHVSDELFYSMSGSEVGFNNLVVKLVAGLRSL